jgi:hypothetical protein
LNILKNRVRASFELSATCLSTVVWLKLMPSLSLHSLCNKTFVDATRKQFSTKEPSVKGSDLTGNRMYQLTSMACAE